MAVLTVASGMVGTHSLSAARADASAKNTDSGEGKEPHLTDPVIAIAAQAGFNAVSGQSIQLTNGEIVALMSGGDVHFVGGGQTRMHNGQGIGVLAGAVNSSQNGVGLQLIAAKDLIEIQAQADSLKVQARDEVNVMSVTAHVDFAAAKIISLSTAGGAKITIESGNVALQCPGKITVHASKKSFSGASNIKNQFPELPRGAMHFDEKFQLADPAGDPVKNVRYAIIKQDGGRIEGVTDDAGLIPLQQGFSPEKLRIIILGKV